MRIAQIVTQRQRRGAEVFASELSGALGARGHEVFFVGLNVHAGRPLSPEGAVSVDLVRRAPRKLDMGLVASTGRWLRRARPEVIQANGGYALKYVTIARRLYRVDAPIVYRNIGLSSDWLRGPGQRLWIRWLLGGIQASASVSAASRDDLLATYGLDPGIATVIRRGVPMHTEDGPRARDSLRRELGLEPDAAILIHVGSFSPEKNHAGLLRILERIRPSYPDVHLVLVGDGPLRPQIEAALPAEGRVHLLGTRVDVPRLLAGADLLTLPSTTEGIPGVILEAGVQSLPAVAYGVGGVGEVVLDGETGRLIEAGDEAAFADTVQELLRDETTRRAMGRAARRLIETDYSLDRSVDSFERLYERVVHS